MRFISNGDYIFPFQFPQYLAQHIYMWSYQSGAANPDGIMRLPGRLIDLLVFALFGNIGIGYFYVVLCLAVTFVSFWWFARVFLEVQQRGVVLLGAALFTFNPIYLGNLSKVGLIMASAMLLVALAALKQAFDRKRFVYFLIAIAALNIALIHPFTFTVDLLASGVYFVQLVRTHTTWARDNIAKFVGMGMLAILLNAYCLLPLASLGTLDKGALSSTVTSAPVDYTSLVDIANTGDVFTGLSLSKAVLKDYNFYGARSWPFYFLGAFMLYALLFGIYARVEKRLKPHERRRFVLALAAFLALLVLSTATFLHVDALLKFIIGLPGGWMFRSPLKWQLYMPLGLFTAIVIALAYVRPGKGLKLIYAAFGLSFVLMNGYLCTQVYSKLLVPRSLQYFGALADVQFTHQNLLFVDSTQCTMFARDNPGVATELNQIFISKDVQVKHVSAGDLDTVNAGAFDYVMGCQQSLGSTVLTQRYAFAAQATFARNTYVLYKNDHATPYIDAIAAPFAVSKPAGLSGKSSLATGMLGRPFNFLSDPAAGHPAQGIQDMFDELSPRSIQGSALTSSITPLDAGLQHVYVTGAPAYYRANGTSLEIHATPGGGTIKTTASPITMTVPSGKHLQVTYSDPSYSYKNMIDGGSFEGALWQPKVGDCDNYDNQASIAMARDASIGTDGKASLELTAGKHIACTGPHDIAVTPGQHYLLSFDYLSAKSGQYAGYFIGFDSTDGSSYGQRLPDKSGRWTTFSTELIAPQGATSLHLLLYAFADGTPGRSGQAHYDNVKLVNIPDIKNRIFVVGQPAIAMNPPAIQSHSVNPTKNLITATGATTPFYLSSKESYGGLWRLTLDNNAHGFAGLTSAGKLVPASDHVRINGTMNGWYIDPSALCASAPAGCIHNSDGSWTMHFVMSFAPQKWFYIGAMVSGISLIGTLSWVAYEIHRHHRQKGGRV